MDWKVPLFDLDFGDAERAAVQAVIDDEWLTMGPRTSEFEERFVAFTRARHAIAVANGTAALHLGLLAAGVGPGDEVIVPDITFIASANAAAYVGAMAVLADVCSVDDLTLDPDDVRAKITPRTRAIVPVHLAGYPCRMAELVDIAEEHGLAIVEDCAHAPGALYGGTHVGRFGQVGCFSFFSNKNLSTGEGGMVITDDDELAARVRAARSHGLTSGTADRNAGHAWGYDVTQLGYNYRLSEIEAALGIVQLERLPSRNERRGGLTRLYRDRLTEIPGVTPAFHDWERQRPAGCASAYHVEIVVLPEGAPRAAVADSMAAEGIQTSLHYRPIHTFSSSHVRAMRSDGLARAHGLGERLITLPLYPSMGDATVVTVVDALARALDRAGAHR